MRCRVCGTDGCLPLWIGADETVWERCWCCFSDSSNALYDPAMYNPFYMTHHAQAESREARLEQLRSNVEWFRDYKPQCAGRDFVDVGHCDGLMLTAMQDDGWRVHGFDVFPEANLGPHTTIAPVFRANLFPQRYQALNCREVIEHVPGWRQMLVEMREALAHGGLLQLQTPRPTPGVQTAGYQRAHLQLFSPLALRYELERIGFSILDIRLWDLGQAFMAKRV